eukprot:6548221-Prymnesium_polylepis.1
MPFLCRHRRKRHLVRRVCPEGKVARSLRARTVAHSASRALRIIFCFEANALGQRLRRIEADPREPHEQQTEERQERL